MIVSQQLHNTEINSIRIEKLYEYECVCYRAKNLINVHFTVLDISKSQ